MDLQQPGAQVGHGELELALDQAGDPQPERLLVELGHRAVAADVEGVRGGQRALGQRGAGSTPR